MKWNELRRIAEKNGWYFVRTGGNHDIYAHPNKSGILEIERHGSQEVKTKLYYKLKKQIGF
jgi:predicted RNA binding protein YcfA (HicA-like mRNA interferase family)